MASIAAGVAIALSGATGVLPAPVAGASGTCRSGTPLANVYHPYRLQVLTDCMSVSGTVASVRHEDDGDIHVNLSLPASESHLLNTANINDEHGDLVTEIVPADQPGCTPGQPPPLPSTAYTTPGYSYGTCTGTDIATPSIGEQVTVTGPYVLDKDHGWMEIHPVWSITTGSSSTTAPATGSTTTAPAKGATTSDLSQWAATNRGAVVSLTRAAVSYKRHSRTRKTCTALAHAAKKAKKASRPPAAQKTWHKALTNLQRSSRRCRAGGGKTPVARANVRRHVRLGLVGLAHVARHLVHDGTHLGTVLLIIVGIRHAHGNATSATTTTTPAPATTAPPPPTTTTSPPTTTTTTTAPPPPPATTTPPSTCYPTTDSGNCYKPGEYCRTATRGRTGIAATGEAIICTTNDGLRWEPLT